MLPYDKLQKPEGEELKASTIVRGASGSKDNKLEYLVNFPGKTLSPAGSYDLMLVPISDGRIRLTETKVELKQNQSGDWAGSFSVDMASRLYPTIGQGFGGVIGGVVRSKTGEIVGKVQLGYLTETNLVSLP